MTVGPLIEELRRKGREDVDALWEKVKAEAAAYERDRLRGLEDQKKDGAQQAATKAGELERTAIGAAETEARRNIAMARAALADRLHTLALESIAAIGAEHDRDLFGALVAELPMRNWERVTVNPRDRAAARKAFPDAEVRIDASIGAGVEVEQGPVRVSNTLEARLESAWPEILPALMKEIQEEARHS